MAGFCVSGFKVQPVGPPPPPPPPAAVTVGLGPYLNSGFTVNTKIFTLPSPQLPLGVSIPVQVGDILVAAMVGWNTTNHSMAGNMPAGFTLVREDYQVATQSMYTGIAVKTAVLADTVAQNILTDVPFYTFVNPFAALGVGIACIHNSAGVDATSYTAQANGTALSIAGATASQAGELVLLLAYAGTPAGAAYINAGTNNSTANSSDLPLCIANGFTDSALRIFYLNSPTAGTSPSHDIIPAPGASGPGHPEFPAAGYMVTMLGA